MTTRSELRRPVAADEPSLRAVSFSSSSGAGSVRLLTKAQRQQVASIATRVRLRPRAVIYHADSPAGWVFINAGGVVKAFRDLPSGKHRIAAFHFAEDIFGLAENGLYVNTLQAVTEVRLHRIPVEELRRLFMDDGQLQFQFLCKITDELRRFQRQKIVLTRRDAVGRVAMFLSMLEQRLPDAGPAIDLPMTRSDIASYLGLSLEAVSRATAALTQRRIVTFASRHAAKIVDRARFDKLVAEV